ncbi:MAG: hypothetical protein HY754_03340 [Nitrospirae bacterium]|nr:hypothetical protein [Nitrospirota bacterium]
MKRAIIIIGLITALLSIPSFVFSIETAPRISDREIVERLSKLETKVDEGFKSVDKRFEGLDKRFEGIDKRFDDLNAQLNRISAIFTALVIAVFGFAIWDRRTMIRPFETKIKKIEDEIADNRSKLNTLIDSLKSLSKTDDKVAEILKKFNLL